MFTAACAVLQMQVVVELPNSEETNLIVLLVGVCTYVLKTGAVGHLLQGGTSVVQDLCTHPSMTSNELLISGHYWYPSVTSSSVIMYPGPVLVI